MTENERFFMVFFNDNAIPMPATQLVSATAENQRYYLNWMVTGRAGGKTKPEAALLTALQLRPEVIYFLTDGQFRFRVVEAVTRANQGGVTINTIGFGGDQGEDFLKALATQNGGVYRFIPDVEQIEEEPVPANPPKITKLPEFN